MPSSEKPTARKIAGAIGKISTFVLAIVFLLVLSTFAVVASQLGRGSQPTVLGYRFYRIVTPSMTGVRPDSLSVGDVIVSRVLSPDAPLKPGDVVTYVAPGPDPRKGLLITHRLVAVDVERDAYVTKGDANPVSDTPIRRKDISSKMLKKSPFLTSLHRFLSDRGSFFLFLIVPLTILVVLIVRLIALIRTPASSYSRAPSVAALERRKAEIRKKAVESYIASLRSAPDSEPASSSDLKSAASSDSESDFSSDSESNLSSDSELDLSPDSDSASPSSPDPAPFSDLKSADSSDSESDLSPDSDPVSPSSPDPAPFSDLKSVKSSDLDSDSSVVAESDAVLDARTASDSAAVFSPDSD